MKQIKIDENSSGQRLDRFLMKYLDKSSRNNIYKLIRKKVFKVNDKRANAETMIYADDVLSIYLADESLQSLISTEDQKQQDKREYTKKVNLDIVYEDDDMLIVNKPKGLLVHPDKSEYKNTLSSQVSVYLKEYSTRTFKPAPAHRLDKNTSGLVIFAKTYQALKRLNEDIRNRKIQKKYLCVVHGHIYEAAKIRGWLIKDEDKNKSRLVKDDCCGGKYSETSYTPLANYVDERNNEYSLLEVDLHTGRSHQIRVMLSSINHPIVGDVKYGARFNKQVSGQLLHAYKLIINEIEYKKYSKQIDLFISGFSKI